MSVDILISNSQLNDGLERKPCKKSPVPASKVYAVDWSLDGARVATGSKDRLLKIWRH